MYVLFSLLITIYVKIKAVTRSDKVRQGHENRIVMCESSHRPTDKEIRSSVSDSRRRYHQLFCLSSAAFIKCKTRKFLDILVMSVIFLYKHI